MTKKIRIAHLAGPNATITNSPPLVTANKARKKFGLPLLTDADGAASRFDVLRPQRLAAPATVYVEQFTAQPLEADAAPLYGPPDGYLNAQGEFSETRRGATDRPVYRIDLDPQDGYYPLPYMARQSDGRAWETDGTSERASRQETRQPFAPDGSRIFEEIDRFGIGGLGLGNLISDRADIDFYRIAPPGGYMTGLAADRRTDMGAGDIPEETAGIDFFPYRPHHLHKAPGRSTLARVTNLTRNILAGGKYQGAIWTEGSPCIEETMYWLNLALDVDVPICGNAAQRQHGMIGNDGPRNIVDSIDYLSSPIWADADGRNRLGIVLIQDQRIFAARDVAKGDARPGGFVVTGGHGGVLGSVGSRAGAVLLYVPATKHTYRSEVNVANLPASVDGIAQSGSTRHLVDIPIKNAGNELHDGAIPKVSILKDGSYAENDDAVHEVDVAALVDYKLKNTPLSGFVIEGWSPFGRSPSNSRSAALERAVYLGFPVVCVGRGNTEGFATRTGMFIGGSNLTATKARLLLMLCIMKFGMLPPAQDPNAPTRDEKAAIERRLAEYQRIFETH